jgi:formate dehydrogenase iron-sulfur subunit
MSYAMLIDTTRCIGCMACQEACQSEYGMPVSEQKVLSATARTTVEERGDYFVRRMCMHCDQPACVSVCPVGALQKTAEGPVIYDATACMGCRYCMVACPFSVPRYEWHSVTPRVQKCTMCYHRLKEGKQPACAEVCPAEAVTFGTKKEILAEARLRIVEHGDEYVPKIYGERVVGGTSVFFLSAVPFEQLGMKVNLGEQPMPELTWQALSKIPEVVSLGGAFMMGLFWIIDRRNKNGKLTSKYNGEGS